MASDDEPYLYYDEDEAAEEDDGLEADEDDVGLFEEAAPQPERRADHWAITRKSLSAAQQQDVSMVMNLVNVARHNARALLMHHRWKMDRIHDFLERRGREGLFRDAGIVVPPEDCGTATRARAAPHKRPRIVTCNVCFEDVARPSDVSTMDCGHCFCNDCWTEHFLASVGNGKKHIHCMQVKCPAICDDATVRRLLGRKYPDTAKRFDNLVLDSYLDNNASVKWCPSTPHCGRAIRIVDASERYCEVECPCGASFCFNCTAPAHSPCPCPMWDKWDAKFRGESENLKWIAVNTKSCPNCLRPIEKANLAIAKVLFEHQQWQLEENAELQPVRRGRPRRQLRQHQAADAALHALLRPVQRARQLAQGGAGGAVAGRPEAGGAAGVGHRHPAAHQGGQLAGPRAPGVAGVAPRARPLLRLRLLHVRRRGAHLPVGEGQPGRGRAPPGHAGDLQPRQDRRHALQGDVQGHPGRAAATAPGAHDHRRLPPRRTRQGQGSPGLRSRWIMGGRFPLYMQGWLLLTFLWSSIGDSKLGRPARAR
uniref:RBR-type E3 ubiquitin transferase n=1 Tax=Hordeum vulgare subsp. vulgare TaxID=112509 RepID=F2DM55_HORVV|nr:predicted protein [Hordeum vulgare subsp. vulgare]